MSSVTVTLMGKVGCHLCDVARDVVADVLAHHPEVTLEEVSIEDKPLWSEQYGELIPVVFIDGVEHSHWRVDPQDFAEALSQSADLSSSPTPRRVNSR